MVKAGMSLDLSSQAFHVVDAGTGVALNRFEYLDGIRRLPIIRGGYQCHYRTFPVHHKARSMPSGSFRGSLPAPHLHSINLHTYQDTDPYLSM